MNLSNTKRVSKLLGNLLTHPQYWHRYLKQLPLQKHYPLDLEIPWWSYAAIDYIERLCCGRESVFEYGTGGSTLFFAKRCHNVCAVEDDPNWYRKILERLGSSELTNVNLLLKPFDFKAPVNFDSSGYLQALNKAYDIIVIDGQDWTFGQRPICFRRAEEFVRAGGLIIVDDSWRYCALRSLNKAKKVKVFESVGPFRYGVTSTDVYFY